MTRASSPAAAVVHGHVHCQALRKYTQLPQVTNCGGLADFPDIFKANLWVRGLSNEKDANEALSALKARSCMSAMPHAWPLGCPGQHARQLQHAHMALDSALFSLVLMCCGLYQHGSWMTGPSGGSCTGIVSAGSSASQRAPCLGCRFKCRFRLISTYAVSQAYFAIPAHGPCSAPNAGLLAMVLTGQLPALPAWYCTCRHRLCFTYAATDAP